MHCTPLSSGAPNVNALAAMLVFMFPFSQDAHEGSLMLLCVYCPFAPSAPATHCRISCTAPFAPAPAVKCFPCVRCGRKCVRASLVSLSTFNATQRVQLPLPLLQQHTYWSRPPSQPGHCKRKPWSLCGGPGATNRATAAHHRSHLQVSSGRPVANAHSCVVGKLCIYGLLLSSCGLDVSKIVHVGVEVLGVLTEPHCGLLDRTCAYLQPVHFIHFVPERSPEPHCDLLDGTSLPAACPFQRAMDPQAQHASALPCFKGLPLVIAQEEK
eukprot:scaffold13086_cov20-Tisochrysis_lutea.AAC.2